MGQFGLKALFIIAAISAAVFISLVLILPDSQPTEEMLLKIYECNVDLKGLQSELRDLSEQKEAVELLYNSAVARLERVNEKWSDTKKKLEELKIQQQQQQESQFTTKQSDVTEHPNGPSTDSKDSKHSNELNEAVVSGTNPLIAPSKSQSSESSESFKSLQRPEYPALVLQGPPKCGTRTFIDTLSRFDDVVQFGPERSFWAGPNQWRCYPPFNDSQWISYLIRFENGNATFNEMVTSIVEFEENKYCNPDRYRWHWNKIPSLMDNPEGLGQYWINKTCQHPNASLDTSSHNRYCQLIEKGPVYTRAPWVGPVYVLLMPKIKLITIIRDPMTQIVSALFAFPEERNVFKFDSENMERTHHWMVEEFMKDTAFMNFSAMCSELNNQWMVLEEEGKSGRDRYLKMMDEYRHFLVVYLWRRFVDKEFMTVPRVDIHKWSALLLPSTLATLGAWEERKGMGFMRNEWDPKGEHEYYESRYIQFEWMFQNVAEAMKLVKCWMMDLKDDVQCEKEMKRTERGLFGGVEHSNSDRANKTRLEDKGYREGMQPLWKPCNLAMQHIVLEDRPQLLLGGWSDWNYLE